MAVKKGTLMLVGLVLLAIGVAMVYVGWSTPYSIKDMNGDGVIDWKDYDVNQDNYVDMRDIVMVARAYGSSYGDYEYNPRCDFNQDGVIDEYDVNAIKVYFGQGLSLVGLIAFRLTGERGPFLLFGIASACVGLAVLVVAGLRKR